MTVYLDLDGVLADFDRAAGHILGTDNIYRYQFVHGAEDFWGRLSASGTFFADMPVMPDANKLLDNLSSVNTAVLTALPRTDSELVKEQKTAWVRKHIGWHIPVYTCRTLDKPKFCLPGDILIDDRAVNRKAWEAAGGIFILHVGAYETLWSLKEMAVIK